MDEMIVERLGYAMWFNPPEGDAADAHWLAADALAEIERLRAEVADAMLGQEQVRMAVADELASVLASRAEWMEHAEAALAKVERLRAAGYALAVHLEAANGDRHYVRILLDAWQEVCREQ